MRDSIYVKWVALTTVLIACIVGFLTLYLRSHEIAAREDNQLSRVSTYGDLLAGQLRSAIAFHDQETAREVLAALDQTPDVVSSVLFDSDGAVMSERGVRSAWVSRASGGVQSKRVFTVNDRVAVVIPVVSLEGPTGTLVIELSRAGIMKRRVALILTAVTVGVTVIFAGVLVMTLAARRFVRRLRAIGDVASEVAASSNKSRSVPIDAWDEIGVLAAAFNNMVAQVRDERARLQSTVSELTRTENELERANRDLEVRVETRTTELRSANELLVMEMRRRSEIEIELRQAQKLESVGRLAAGVAHEINTPIQFVSDSVYFVRDSAERLLRAIETQQVLVGALTTGSATEEIAESASSALEAADLEFVRDELPLALDRMTDGLERVTVIVRSMQVFSHQNTARAPVDLNRAVDSTLTIARNEYKHVADVETHYADLPPIVCEGGEINQVILNILLNSAHAISDAVKHGHSRGKITVRTWQERQHACISIADTGGGIPEAVRERMYDPFFTTKDVGRGTGQGLAIARSVIVERHGGTLDCNSEVGVGTEFIVRIPMRPRVERLVAA